MEVLKKTFLLIAQVVFVTHSINNQDKAELAAALKHYFHSRCTFILGTKSLYDTSQMTQIQRYLSVRGIDCATLHTLNETHCCNYSRELFIIPSIHLMPLLIGQRLSSRKLLVFIPTVPEPLTRYLKDIHLPLDSYLLIAERTGLGIVLTEAFSVAKDYPLQTHRWATWDHIKGLRRLSGSTHSRRRDLQGASLRVVAYEDHPFLWTVGDCKKKFHLKGFFGAVWELLQDHLNFTSVYPMCSTRMVGALVNGTWNGAIGMLQRGEVDVAVGDFTVTAPRALVIQFSLPLVISRFSVYIKQHRREPLYLNTFLKPFSSSLWFAVVLSLLLLTTTLWFTSHNRDVGALVLFVLACFCQRAQPWPPSSRVLIFATLPPATTILAAYSGSLVSYLTVTDQTPPFETLHGLLQDSSYQLDMIANTAHVEDFQTSQNTILHQLYVTRLQDRLSDLPATLEEGVRRLCFMDKYSFMMSMENAQHATRSAQCGLVELRRASLVDNLALAFTRNSPYKGIINYSIHKLRHSGILDKIRQDLYFTTEASDADNFQSMNIRETTSFFAILASGVILGIFILGVEHYLTVNYRSNSSS